MSPFPASLQLVLEELEAARAFAEAVLSIPEGIDQTTQNDSISCPNLLLCTLFLKLTLSSSATGHWGIFGRKGISTHPSEEEGLKAITKQT